MPVQKPAPHVAAVHDLSGMGRCALTIVLPVLSAMGSWCSPLLTAWLSASTIYPQSPHFAVRDLTDEMAETSAYWGEIGARFDAVYSGFVGSERQIAVVEDFIRSFRKADTLVVVDPVMGDRGVTYRTYTPDMCRRMGDLAALADVITPNFTEAAILLNEPYSARPTDMAGLETWLKRLSLDGRRSVILTGVQPQEGKVGAASFDRESGKVSLALADEVPAHFPGTGDLFTSVALGALLRGESLEAASALAVDFVAECARFTLALGTPTEAGVQFESLLGRLIP